MRYKCEFWYTLEDVWRYLILGYGDGSESYQVWNCSNPCVVVEAYNDVDNHTVINHYCGYSHTGSAYQTLDEKIDFTDSTIIDLWNRIYAKYLTHYILCTNYPDIKRDNLISIGKWINKFNNILIDTQDKYKELINGYSSVKNHLMDGLKSQASINIETEGSQRFNDTPNGKFVDGNYEGDDYISTINLDTGKNDTSEAREWDSMTAMQKLNEIDTLYKSAMSSWVKEFDKLFIEEVNIG